VIGNAKERNVGPLGEKGSKKRGKDVGLSPHKKDNQRERRGADGVGKNAKGGKGHHNALSILQGCANVYS